MTKRYEIAEQLRLFGGLPTSMTYDAPDRQKLLRRLRAAQKQHLVQVSPGIYRTVGAVVPPDLIIARMVDRGNGNYELVPAYEQWVRITPPLIHALGIQGQYHTVYRLGRCGFIEIAYYAPKSLMINLSSWWGHLANVIEDPQFWDPETKKGAERLKLYRENMY